MILTKLLPLLMLLTLFRTIVDEPITVDPSKPLGDVASIEGSVAQFERKFNEIIILPHYLPFTPTHSGGHFDESQKQVRIDYLNNTKNSQELLSLKIIFGKIHLKIEKSAQFVKLEDNTEAKYIHSRTTVFDFLKLEKGGLTYFIAISKNNNKDTLTELLKVANSLR